MTIRVYPSHMEGQPIETHEWTGTLAGFFTSKGLSYTLAEQPKSVVTVNGEPLPMTEWAKRHLAASDDVEIRLIQHGGIFKGLGSILGGVLGFVFGFLMPGQKGGRDYNAPGQGKQLETAQAKANTARLNEVVPELAGRFKRYPDYLTPPRRFFRNKREQLLEFHACVGPGYYLINPDEVKIGDTPFSALGEDASYQIFEPDADLSSISTHEHWHTADEVGGTSSGTAGLELSTEIANRENTDPESYHFDGLTITREQGEFPPAWGTGTTVRVSLPMQYAVGVHTTGVWPNEVTYSTWTGYFDHMPMGVPATSGRFEGWIPEAQAVNGGTKTVVFYKMAGDPPSKQYLTGEPIGTRSYVFGDLVDRTLSEYSETEIVVEGLPFPADMDVAGSKVQFSGGTVYGEWTSEFVVTPGNELTTTLELDFFFPGGLVYIRDDGGLQNRTVGIEYQYRDARGGARTTVRKTYTDKTLDQIGYTERFNVPSMRAAVRVRRVGASSTSTQVHDTVHWYGLKCCLRTVTRYPRWTTMSVQLRSGGRLAAQSENQINVLATRKLHVLLQDGSWSQDLRPTKDISAFVRHIAHSIGYTDENLDMAELRRLHDLWAARGDSYSYVVDLTTVKEAINSAFAAGMAELTVANGEIRPVREGVRIQHEHVYSPQNMTGTLRRNFRNKQHDDNDGIELEYFDSETFTSKTVICALPDSPRVKLRKEKLNFTATRKQAWQIGMREARRLRYQRWEYSFGTEMDALNSEYGSRVALFDDLIGRGQSALLRHIAPHEGGAELYVTEPLRWIEGKGHVVAYRRHDGSFAGPWAATKGYDDYSVIADIPTPWPEVTLKQELPHIFFGPADKFEFPALITDIKPQGTDRATVTAVNYDARTYADDNNEPSE